MGRKKDDDPPSPKACLFKSTAFEASDDDFQDTPLFRKGVVINEKTPVSAVSTNVSVEAALSAHIPSTDCTFDCMTSKKYQSKAIKENMPSDNIKKNFKTFCESTSLTQSGSKRKVYAILKCEPRGTVWNRDVNSAFNIYDIFVYKSKHNNESPTKEANGVPWI
ncbi:hypothetical protein G6F70_002114 [Rhizopus microsporus]|nr:hypothetical protein G6F71_002928 [Rhizopus microsporus]KAG1202620.1 hypothetical protein G6F70_002114 [Rhizopus microsporus]KAG1214292.1 hypothetical protein G6F69_002065 [Rhizopus microsporus]KAG1236816.1 hypothetical protein G6F67_001699 [Rhizopus microsporus]KAG1267872.1 hypothetical protein G6F68_001575 [Rhizopus microsporus]